MTRSADEPFTLYGLIAESIRNRRRARRDRISSQPGQRISPTVRRSSRPMSSSPSISSRRKVGPSSGRPSASSGASRRPTSGRCGTSTFPAPTTGSCRLFSRSCRCWSHAHTDAEHFEDQTLQIPAGVRSLSGRGGGPGRAARARTRSQLLGPEPADRKGPPQFRYDPHRLLPRRERDFEAFKAGLIDYRFQGRRHALAVPVRFPRCEGRARRHDVHSRRPAQGRFRLGLPIRGAACSPTRGCARRWPLFSTSSGSTPIFTGAYRRSEGFFDDSELSSD